MIEELKKSMVPEFEMTDIGLMSCYLGVVVSQSDEGILYLPKEICSWDLEEVQDGEFKINGYSSWNRNEVNQEKAMCKDGSHIFQKFGRTLWYLIATRHDILYAVGLISRYKKSPTQIHLQATKRILRYIKGTLDMVCSIHLVIILHLRDI